MPCCTEEVREQVLRFMGYRDPQNAPRWIEALIADKLPVAESVCTPTENSTIVTAEDCSDRICELVDSETDFDAVAFILVSLGQGLEKKVSSILSNGHTVEALVLDAIGTVMLFNMAAELIERVYEEGTDCGLYPLMRIEPGQRNIPLALHRDILENLPAVKEIVSLSDSLMLNPKKSLSTVLLLSRQKNEEFSDKGCEGCAMENCQFRKSKERDIAED